MDTERKDKYVSLLRAQDIDVVDVVIGEEEDSAEFVVADEMSAYKAAYIFRHNFDVRVARQRDYFGDFNGRWRVMTEAKR